MKISFTMLTRISVIFFLLGSHGYSQTVTAPSATPLERSKYLLRSGVAFDASEDIFGLIHIKEPKNFFKPDTEQVTWWGEFQPFKAWGRPELEAKWYSPQGACIATQQFRGSVCRLAKTTLKMEGSDTANMQGLWRVEVYHKGQLLDQKQFSIYGGGPIPASVSVGLGSQQEVPV